MRHFSKPDVAAARAEQEAALRDIEAFFPPEAPAEAKKHLMDALTGKGTSVSSGKGITVSYFDSPNPELNARFKRFYAAREKLGEEERREKSIASARGMVVTVVVALGTPPNGTVAAVLRRISKTPTDVIVLGPNATGETLGAAFHVLDQSRENYGDAIENDHVIGIQEAKAAQVDPNYLKYMDNMVAKLRRAPTRPVDGVGNVQAIDMNSRPLKKL
jgi:hypothetical protein